MILKTPIQDQEIEGSNLVPIRKVYEAFEETFVILHPFLIVKDGYNIRFDTWKRPTKNDIYEGTLPITWTEIVSQAKLKDIKELDGVVAYLHCGRQKTDRDAWLKFMRYIDNAKLIIPQVDDYPQILINPTLQMFIYMGYNNILMYSDISDVKTSYSIAELIESGDDLPGSCLRILTPDNKLLLATDSDARFSYLSSDKENLKFIIDKLNLEGFYCNDTTRSPWSYQPLTSNAIDWSSPERKNYL
jgi:hypothetical protein